jgi:ABC-type antimicrobial peptide transport system permease subunit
VVNSERLGTFQLHPEPAIYLPMWQDSLPRMTMIVHARDVSSPKLVDFRRKIEAVPGHGPIPPLVKTFEAHLTQTSLAPLRIATTILGAFAAIGVLLSILGLFGALSDAARQRRRELAVRIALGAQRWRVICQVLGEAGRLACTGTVAGMLGSLLLSRWMTGITGRTSSPALWVWLAAPLLLTGVVASAGVLPARRALMVNPVIVMREE